jgi:hypothetical protein
MNNKIACDRLWVDYRVNRINFRVHKNTQWAIYAHINHVHHCSGPGNYTNHFTALHTYSVHYTSLPFTALHSLLLSTLRFINITLDTLSVNTLPCPPRLTFSVSLSWICARYRELSLSSLLVAGSSPQWTCLQMSNTVPICELSR